MRRKFGGVSLVIILYKRRWLMLFIWLLNYINMISMWYSFVSITDEAAKFYNTSLSMIELLATMFMVIEIPMLLVALWIFGRFGLRTGISITAVCGCIGAWVRFFGCHPDRYWLLLTGQVIAAIGQGFMDASFTKLSAAWFGESERTTAVGILVCGITLSGASLLYLTPILIETPRHLWVAFLSQSCAATLCLILTAIFFRSEPPTPPSSSGTFRRSLAHNSFMSREVNSSGSFRREVSFQFRNSMKRTILNKQFLLLFFSYGLAQGAYSFLLTCMTRIVTASGYTQADSGLFAAILVTCGTIGSVIVGVVVDKTKRYQLIIIVILILDIAFCLLLHFALIPNQKVFLVVVFVAIGMCMISLNPVYLECCAEVNFPIREEYSAAFATVASSAFGSVAVIIFGNVVAEQAGDKIAVWITVGMLVLALAPVLFWRPKYKRYEFERHGYDPVLSFQT